MYNYPYYRVDWLAAKEAAVALSKTITNKVDQTEIQPAWDEVQTCLEDLIKTHVPSKVVKDNRTPTCFNKELKDKVLARDQACH